MKHARVATSTSPAPSADDDLDQSGPGALMGNPFQLSADQQSAPDPASGPAAGPADLGGPGGPGADVTPSGPADPVAPGVPITQADRRDALDLTAVAPHPGEPIAAPGFLSPAPPRRPFESALVRLIATAGVIGIGTAVGAILVANSVAGWITGLVVSAVSVVLAAILWRSRRL